MEKSFIIRSVESKVKLPESALEDYVNRFSTKRTREKNFGTASSPFLNHFENIDICSAHSPVDGTIEIVINSGKSISIPVVTGFLVTCIKGEDNLYKVKWSCSMS